MESDMPVAVEREMTPDALPAVTPGTFGIPAIGGSTPEGSESSHTLITGTDIRIGEDRGDIVDMAKTSKSPARPAPKSEPKKTTAKSSSSRSRSVSRKRQPKTPARSQSTSRARASKATPKAASKSPKRSPSKGPKRSPSKGPTKKGSPGRPRKSTPARVKSPARVKTPATTKTVKTPAKTPAASKTPAAAKTPATSSASRNRSTSRPRKPAATSTPIVTGANAVEISPLLQRFVRQSRSVERRTPFSKAQTGTLRLSSSRSPSKAARGSWCPFDNRVCTAVCNKGSTVQKTIVRNKNKIIQTIFWLLLVGLLVYVLLHTNPTKLRAQLTKLPAQISECSQKAWKTVKKNLNLQ